MQLLDVVEGIEHQQGVLELIPGQLGHGGVTVGQEGDEGGHVITSLHGSQQFNGAGTGDEGGCLVAQGEGGEVGGLGVGRLVDSGGDAVGEEIDELRVLGRKEVGWEKDRVRSDRFVYSLEIAAHHRLHPI